MNHPKVEMLQVSLQKLWSKKVQGKKAAKLMIEAELTITNKNNRARFRKYKFKPFHAGRGDNKTSLMTGLLNKDELENDDLISFDQITGWFQNMLAILKFCFYKIKEGEKLGKLRKIV